MSEASKDQGMPNKLTAGADTPPKQVDVVAMHAPTMREKLEPRDGDGAVPLWLATVFGALLFWGGYYLSNYSGGFRGDVLDEDPAARMGAATGPAGPVDPVVLGKRLYTGNCISCHQATGQGVLGQYPPLAGSEWVNGSPARIKRIVLHGFEGPVTVNGVRYNAAMAAFGKKLNDLQIAAVLTYIRQEWGNSASPVGPEDVAATRAATAARTSAFTEAELLAITADDAAPTTRQGDATKTP